MAEPTRTWVNGQEVDVLPDTFDKLPETMDTASRKDVVSRIERAVPQREWANG
ncbi:hypothetical protein [Streptomyces uncialis]|uniref:hypothetical protein n=1 Tax=Streptomyces uncialis TaxID=1048205 RepID=UPI003867A315|nr:hypothetical protein OG268_05985 [Streptomyces uncialis]